MGMTDANVRKVLHAKDDKPLLPEKVLRRPREEYVELDQTIEYSKKAADKFYEDGYISLPTNVTPKLNYIARYRNEIEQNYPLSEPTTELPQISHTVYYHDFRVTTNGSHRSLPFLNRVEKAKMKMLFNKDRRVVAIQMIFNNINEDDKAEIYNTLESKYSKEIQTATHALKYLVSRNIKLYTSYGEKDTVVKPSKTGTRKGETTQRDYTITNFYYHTTKFPKAIKNKMLEEPLFENLL
jgi:hypothetical protein